MTLNQQQLTAIAAKALRHLDKLDIQDVPAMIYQILLLSSKGAKSLVVDGILNYFNCTDSKLAADATSDPQAVAHVRHAQVSQLYRLPTLARLAQCCDSSHLLSYSSVLQLAQFTSISYLLFYSSVLRLAQFADSFHSLSYSSVLLLAHCANISHLVCCLKFTVLSLTGHCDSQM